MLRRPLPFWPLYVVRRYPGRAVGFELIGPFGAVGESPVYEDERWHQTARQAAACARKRLRRTRAGGRLWVFKPDGRFYREIVIPGGHVPYL